jgi:GAF domain-containing protein
MASDLRAAVAAGVMASEDAHRSLLQSTVEVARAIFAAQAATIFLYDDETDELVFEAVAGLGAQALIGNRIPSSTGIAGWVLVPRQPLVLEDVTEDPRWGGQEIADRTGYTPKGLMAVPLIHDEDSVGVLQVLDRPQETRFSLQEMELLGLFANQSAIALDLLRKARRARAVLDESGTEIEALARLAGEVDQLEGSKRKSGLDLIRSLEGLLTH